MHADKILNTLNQIKIIYTDVDGTFLNDGCLFRSSKAYSYKNANAMYQLISSDVDVIMTSGRAKENLVPTARLLGLENYIANLGIELVYRQGEKVIQNFGLGAKNAEELKEKIVATGAAELIFKTFGKSIQFYQPWENMLTTHHLFIGEIKIEKIGELVNSNFPELRIIDNGEVPPRFGYHKPHTFHLVPKNVGKKTAVQIDKKERNLQTNQLIGIGDSLEDLSIAPEVGVFFLLGESQSNHFENVIQIQNEDGEGFSRIVDLLIQSGLINATDSATA